MPIDLSHMKRAIEAPQDPLANLPLLDRKAADGLLAMCRQLAIRPGAQASDLVQLDLGTLCCLAVAASKGVDVPAAPAPARISLDVGDRPAVVLPAPVDD